MGMFDYIYVEVDLPDGWNPSGEDFFGGDTFQTKSLDQNMDSFKIDADRNLLLRAYDMQSTGRWYYWDFDGKNGEKVYCDKDTKLENDFSGPYEEFQRINERWVKLHHRDGSLYSGDINFGGGRHYYVATVVEGKVTDIAIDQARHEFFENIDKAVNKG